MDVYLARQPIFDKKKQVVAYEILYRNSFKNTYDTSVDGELATTTVVVDSLVSFGIHTLASGKMAYINFTKKHIMDDLPTLFSPEQLTIELLENIQVDDDFIAKCKALRAKGYKLALDDFVGDDRYDDLMPFIDIIKVDFYSMKTEDRWLIADKYRDLGITLLAEKVESIRDFDEALEMGYDLFQGFFFEKPVICKGKSVSVSTFKYMEILKETVGEEPDFNQMSRIIKSDFSLTYKLLRLINSPAFYTVEEITSIKQALTLLGLNEIRKWTTLIMLRDISSDKPAEIIRVSLVRAVFSEKVAGVFNLKSRDTEAFLLGLFSLIDTIMENPLFEIMEALPLKSDLKSALMGYDNSFHEILRLVKWYEVGDWVKIMKKTDEKNIDHGIINAIYLSAVVEAADIINGM